MAKFIVTPWEVKGDIDYKKLIKEFGTEVLDEKLLRRIGKITGELHYMLRRGIFFSHRDLKWLLDEYEKGNKFYLYTGRGPSGDTHLGHLVPWILTKWLQDKFNAELWFQMTDDEKFLYDRKLNLKEANKMAYENALDVIALGFDAKKTKIFADTDYAGTMYKEAVKVAKKLTFSTAKAVFGFKNETNVGLIFFTSVQAVPAFLPSVLNLPLVLYFFIGHSFWIISPVLIYLGFGKAKKSKLGTNSIIISKFKPCQPRNGILTSAPASASTLKTKFLIPKVSLLITAVPDKGPRISAKSISARTRDTVPVI